MQNIFFSKKKTHVQRDTSINPSGHAAVTEKSLQKRVQDSGFRVQNLKFRGISYIVCKYSTHKHTHTIASEVSWFRFRVWATRIRIGKTCLGLVELNLYVTSNTHWNTRV